MKKYLWMSTAAVVIGALRVNMIFLLTEAYSICDLCKIVFAGLVFCFAFLFIPDKFSTPLTLLAQSTKK